MKFTTLVCAMLLSAARLGSAGASVDVFTDYEDIDIPENNNYNPFEATTKSMYDYRQLSYNGFLAYRVSRLPFIDTKPLGKQAMLGYNDSGISLLGPNSIQPKSAGLGCVGYGSQVYGLWVECTVRVTAYYNLDNETQYPTSVDCGYRGYGNLTKCDFPTEWNETIDLRFEIRDANPTILSEDNLGRESKEVDDYYIRVLLDDFSATYQCDEVDDKEGLCKPYYGLRENELRK